MNKKWLLGIIATITILAIIFILINTCNVKYNELIVDNDKWNNIINDRNSSISISLESIEFNDYNLFIDNKNSTLYYSVIDNSQKYNPSIKYVSNNQVHVVINDMITDEKIDKINDLKIMIYNDTEYRIYNLVPTNYSLLSIIYQDKEDIKKTPIILELFDNHIDVPQRVIKSDGSFRKIKKNELYSFSLFKQSLGNNKRNNHISIFGMERTNEYLLEKVDNINDGERLVRVFINNEDMGIYKIQPKEGRVNNYERNKENNR